MFKKNSLVLATVLFSSISAFGMSDSELIKKAENVGLKANTSIKTRSLKLVDNPKIQLRKRK